MNKFITTYKWVSLPVLLCSAAVVSTATFATPTATQQYNDAKQTSRVNHEYIGGNTQIGAGITDQGNIDVNVNQVLFEGQDSSTSGGLWAGFDAVGDDKGFEGGGVELNHNWVSRYDNGEASRVNKAKIAYDQNEAGHDKVTLGYGQETEDLFWEGRVSKGLSGRKDTRSSGDDTISDRGYEYGVGGSIGTFLPDQNLRIRGGLDHEWSSKVGNGESDAKNTTLSAGFDKFFDGTGHSVSLDVSGSKRSGGYDNGGSSDNDYSARLGYKYDFAGSSAFQNATTSRRVRVEVPGYTTPPRTQLQTQYKKVPTYKTVPVYGKKVVKVPYKRMVKSTMALEGQTFFKLNSAKLIPSAQKRLTEVANQIKKSGYKGSIRITGNTCGLGNAQYDQILSERRAKSVRDFLIAKGFNPNHLMARGLGKDHPKFKNIPGEGFKNRRVDIEYVTERSVAKTGYRSEEKTVQTGTRQVATGFKNVANGTKNVMIDGGQKGSPRVIWKTETVKNPPAWIQRALHNNIKHNTNINTYQTTEGFDNQPVLPVNGSPTVNADTAQAVCGLPVNIDVLGNDSDPENENLSIVGFTNGTYGSVTRGPDGTLVYTSNGSGCGQNDTFTYTVEDEFGNSESATVTITVDDKVEAVDETVTVAAGASSVTIDASSNDDPDAVIQGVVTQPQSGTVTFSNGQFIYVPNPGFAGTDTFTYNVIDANGNEDTAVVTVKVEGQANQAPIANDDQETTVAGQPVTLDSLSNDTDPDNTDVLTIQSVSNPANGTAIVTGGQIVYTPDPGFTGTDTFTYIISDGNGGTATATETVIVTAPAAQAPVANNDSGNVVCSGPVTINVLENDSDADTVNSALSIQNFSQGTNGTVTQNTNGELVYTSNGNSCGTNDSFTYTITDGNNTSNTATVTIAIAPQENTKPVAVDDSITTQVGTAVTLPTVVNDTDADGDDLTITNVSTPANGTVTNDGKTITYTPNPGYVGVDIFDYTITDGNGGTSMATETVTITEAPNTKPVAKDDKATTQEGTPVTLSTVANDTDADGDDLTITVVNAPQNGTVTNDGKKITYTPNAGFTGEDTFDYTITDGNGGTATATETITVTAAPNTKPVAKDDKATTQVGTPVTLMTVANDTDADGDDLTISIVTAPQNGTVTNDGKKITYTPDAGFVGIDVFDYTITDGKGGTATATETITVTAAPNTKPVAKDDKATTQEGTPVTLMTVANDSDVDGDDLTITIVNAPQNGTATNDGKKITYTPNPGFTGVDVFDYSITDGNGGTATATETITVTAAPNTKPVAKDDKATTQEGTPVTLMTVANDSDVDGDDLTITIVNAPQNGTATNDGKKITYTPNPGFTGVDVFDYSITDGNGGTATATETITVTAAPNTKPVAKDDKATTQEGTPVTLMTVANDSDADGDDLTITIVNAPQNGTATNDGKKITYTPNPGFTGVDVFDYSITDGNGGTATATETITVTAAPNTKPVAKDDSATTPEATPVTLNTVANDTDADGDDLTITNVQQPQNGSVTNDGKKITYTPKAGFIGMDTFTYTIQDGNGGTATATETVIVEAIPNKAPTAKLDTASSACAVITIDALANDTDPENDALTILNVSGASLGTASVVGNKIQFTPANTCDKDTNGLVKLSYSISDGNNNTATGNVNIDLVGEDVYLKAENDRVTIGVDQTVQINVLANDTGLGLKIVAVDTPLNGQLTFTNNVITYTPNPGYVGQDDFFYDIVDQNGNDYSAQVIVDIESAGKNN